MDTIFDLLSRPAAALALDCRRSPPWSSPRRGWPPWYCVGRPPRRDTSPGAWGSAAPGPAGHDPLHAGLGLAGPAGAHAMDIAANPHRPQSITRPLPAGPKVRKRAARLSPSTLDRATASVRYPFRAGGPGRHRDRATAIGTARARTTSSPWTSLAATWSTVAMLILAVPLAGRFALRRLARRARSIDGGDWSELLRDLAAGWGCRGT